MNYISEKVLSVNEDMLAWCESVLGYICIMQIYDGKCASSAVTMGFLLQPFEGKSTMFTRTNATTMSNLQKSSWTKTSEFLELPV
jgi:hypothetical protein